MTPAPRIGTEFAGYRIEGLLGQGGMGVVYRAEHPRLGATIALKVMDPELATNELFRERFVREARAAAGIKHPNIIPIYDAGEWHGDLYIAMRYIEGEELRSLIRRNGALTAQQTYVIGMQIASALDAAHRNGLIHRDVKPGNILIEPGPDPDSPPIAYLCDLGLTKHVDSHSGVTGSGELLGTIDYIAPEQISDSRVDGRADVYSLACVLFECLTGTVPYVRENQAAVLWAHLHDEIPRATSVSPSLSPAIDAALARGMAKLPENRFATARTLVEALQAPLAATTTSSHDGAKTLSDPTTSRLAAPPAAPRAARRRGRSSTLVLAAAIGLVLGGVAAAAIAFFVSDDEPAAPQTVTVEPPAGEATPDPRLAAFTPFDRELLKHVPDEFRGRCRHARPLNDDFDATVSCRPGGSVSSLTYSHARSGFLLYDYLMTRLPGAGLQRTQPLTLTGSCGAGQIPALNDVIPSGLSGRLDVPEKVTRQERIGYVICYERGSRVRIEWITLEVAVYAAATGEKLGPLYDWWRADAGPEP
ncbi:MAG TPA: serine/threonine-protein kinase [Gaiellaceae bacterium]|nr:serine/threonine-protein kinase [Gaiellaceae bacterium]